jgi:hypothetical protein
MEYTETDSNELISVQQAMWRSPTKRKQKHPWRYIYTPRWPKFKPKHACKWQVILHMRKV